ncbi:hypothetical protein WR25_18524 [Diploscapter pachys]|uniref:Nematode cuticle collagen N-terminal domain-containing protein n=1 Tax=Diploscapter pachys TaxID=2018661 RepID=A0A2A2JEJ5_9BILA|nr:hypothetical protein WR25_18524 [Diploscapter pachys]
MDIDTKIKAYRFVAYSAVVFSVIAVLSVCITLPIVYNYVHTVKRQLHNEAILCKGTAKNVWSDVHKLKNSAFAAPRNNTRFARHAGYSAEAGGGPAFDTGCEGCCQPGPQARIFKKKKIQNKF